MVEPQNGMETRRGKQPSSWLWLLVVPAFLVGLFLPGILVRISWEFASSWIPGVNTLTKRWSEFLQSGVDGFCAVYFAQTIAPYGKVWISIVAAIVVATVSGGVLAGTLLFTNYYEGVGIGTILWNSGLILVTVAAAVVAVRYTLEAKR